MGLHPFTTPRFGSSTASPRNTKALHRFDVTVGEAVIASFIVDATPDRTSWDYARDAIGTLAAFTSPSIQRLVSWARPV